MSKTSRAPVAQLDRAIDFESIGREFEPLRARQPPSFIEPCPASPLFILARDKPPDDFRKQKVLDSRLCRLPHRLSFRRHSFHHLSGIHGPCRIANCVRFVSSLERRAAIPGFERGPALYRPLRPGRLSSLHVGAPLPRRKRPFIEAAHLGRARLPARSVVALFSKGTRPGARPPCYCCHCRPAALLSLAVPSPRRHPASFLRGFRPARRIATSGLALYALAGLGLWIVARHYVHCSLLLPA